MTQGFDARPGINAKIEAMQAEIERLRAGLDAAIRAAELALFVIRKQGVMPNSSWHAGFEKDLATAKAARAIEQLVQSDKEKR